MPQILGTVLPFVAMIAVVYFMLILPEKKRGKKYNEMLNELAVNDKVLTRGGIVGKVIKIEEEYIVIESGPDRTKVQITKQGISSKIEK